MNIANTGDKREKKSSISLSSIFIFESSIQWIQLNRKIQD